MRTLSTAQLVQTQLPAALVMIRSSWRYEVQIRLMAPAVLILSQLKVWLVSAIEGTGTGDSTGVVVNLGSTALTNVNVLNNGGESLSGAMTSVPAGSAAYVYRRIWSITNSTVTDTLLNIDNVTLAGNGKNYVVGSDSANVVTGGTGQLTSST